MLSNFQDIMRKKRKKVLHIVLALSLVLIYIKVNQLIGTSVVTKQTEDLYRSGIDTSGCVIPNIHPWHESILPYVYKMPPLKCEGHPLFHTHGNILQFNRTTVNEELDGITPRCAYQVLTRPNENSDNAFYISEESVFFEEDVNINDEFIYITCYNENGNIIGTYLQAFVILKPEVELRCTHAQQDFVPVLSSDGITPPNVLMIGFDSTSLLNFMRQMPETRELFHSLGAIEMKGYHKVHDNTLVNLMPMLHGTFLHEVNFSREEPFDKYDMIWNHFSRRGYRTLMAEDATAIATFNYLKSGFNKQPTDYYMRPFLIGLEQLIFQQQNLDDLCYAGKHQLVTILDYLDDFLEVFRNSPHFASVYFNLVSHDYINTIGKADHVIKQFIQKIHKDGKLANTFLLFYSDHGLRFGPFRETHVGYHEERLPMFVMLTPEWFNTSHPHLQSNLNVNAQRLVTPFDIHATLREILGNDDTTSSQRGISILKEISERRTCYDASIGMNWCMCYPQIPIDITVRPRYIVEAAEAIVNFMNQAIAAVGYQEKCAILELKTIHSASIIKYDDYIPRNMEIVLKSNLHDKRGKIKERAVVLMVEVEPSREIYQTTVIVNAANGNSYEVWDYVSVVTKTGSGSSCEGMIRAAKYCFCLE